MASPISPALLARLTLPTASIHDPHKRFSVLPGTDTDNPANNPGHIAVILASLLPTTVKNIINPRPIN
jgi:hypothetical protein